MQQQIKTTDYIYDLPENCIAQYPLIQRDHSNLLLYREGSINHHKFFNLPELLAPNATLFFNDTRVIPARLIFRKQTGAQIEVFLLNPLDNTKPVQLALQATENATWHCTIGNLKRWKKGTSIQLVLDNIVLMATLTNGKDGTVSFSWTPGELSFAEVVERLGQTPLPPYLNRDAEAADKSRYQTVYSKCEGAVAAPTAGLHFTNNIINELEVRSIKSEFLTLHVSAGTFQPIKHENAIDHTMHSEQVVVTLKNLETLLEADRKIIAVGTTSLRTLESLYWFGVKLLSGGSRDFVVEQGDPYKINNIKLPTRQEAFERVLSEIGPDKPLVGHTSIYIVPGYTFKVCDGLITNFHQPGSTLMLLVAAFVGPAWKQIYGEALRNGYRFLSYGDSSLLLP